MSQSSYIAYFDESGDHGMQKIDSDFPVFVLCGWVFKIEDYLWEELGAFSDIKFKHFGHDAVVFHSREIRKRIGPFQILSDEKKRTEFLTDISNFYKDTKGILIAAGIHKTRHKKQYSDPVDPYSISLLFCLERLYGHMKDKGESDKTTFCVFEERGANEDQALALTFERICAGDNMWGKLPFRMKFANKQTNMQGLQMADLAAYPIARHIIDSGKPNAAYEVIEKRFRKGPKDRIIGWGLKTFP
jgi:hypothetical protein